MRFTEVCIRRPVLACVLNLILIVIGVVSYQRIEIRYFPEVPKPVATVSIDYPGASAALMESSITNIVEGALSDVPNVNYMTSSSTSSRTRINLYFNLSGDFDQEVNAVRDKVASVKSRLPTSIESTSVTVGGVERPVLNLGFSSTKLSQALMRNYVIQYIQPALSNVTGVGAVWVFGSSDYAMRVWLKPERMAALGITADDVVNTLNANNVDFPAGSVLDPQRTFSVISDIQLKTPQQFGALIVKSVKGSPVYLRNIAKIAWAPSALQQSPMLINGKPGIDVEVRPRFGENPIVVAGKVRQALKRIRARLPKGMQVEVTYDQSTFLRSSISETGMAIFYAVILVILVVLLFLGSFRASFVPIITIPLCLIDGFGVMYLLGFTLNIMTLLALVLAIGLVVDDAIVMLENIHRHIEEGMDAISASIKGSKEIAFAVIAMTITLAAVYAPIGLAQGVSAVVFREFAFTLAGTVIISGFVALTLSPVMCSRILANNAKENKFQQRLERIFSVLANRYKVFLKYVISMRIWVILMLLVVALLGYFLYLAMPGEFVPQEDIGYFTTTVIPPSGSSIKYINRQMGILDKLYAKEAGIAYYASFVLQGGPTSFVSLKPWHERDETQNQILAKLKKEMAAVPGVTAYPVIPSAVDLGDTDSNDMTLQVMTMGTYKALDKQMEKITAALKRYPGLTDVEDNLKFNSQQYKVNLNRQMIGDLGVNPQDVADAMSTMLGGKHVTDVMKGNRSYSVLVQMQKQDLENFQGFSKLYLTTKNPGQTVPLVNLVTLTPAIGQSTLSHYNRMRSGSITGQFMPGYSEQDVVNYVNKVVPGMLTSNQSYTFSGKIKQFLDSQGSMTYMFILSVIFIYLILAATFESFIDPFVILLSVPLSFVGALLVLKLAGGTINLFTNIGMITLVGLIAKHGILITQFANTLQQEGYNLVDAVVESASIRLRPILMTTAAMILGSLPLAFASGPGTISHQQIGWVIVGGLFFGTFFSLVVVPIAYIYLSRLKSKKVYLD